MTKDRGTRPRIVRMTSTQRDEVRDSVGPAPVGYEWYGWVTVAGERTLIVEKMRPGRRPGALSESQLRGRILRLEPITVPLSVRQAEPYVNNMWATLNRQYVCIERFGTFVVGPTGKAPDGTYTMTPDPATSRLTKSLMSAQGWLYQMPVDITPYIGHPTYDPHGTPVEAS